PMLLVEGAIEDEGERLKALSALVEVSLLRHDPFDDGTEAVTVHRLVQVLSFGGAGTRGLAQASPDQMITRLVAIYPDDAYDNPKSWPQCLQLTPHLLALQVAGLDGSSRGANWAELLDRAGGYFHARAAYPQAASLHREALAIREKAL